MSSHSRNSSVDRSSGLTHFRYTWLRAKLNREGELLEDLKKELAKEKHRLAEIQRREENGEGTYLWGFAENCEERIAKLRLDIQDQETRVEDFRKWLNNEPVHCERMRRRMEEMRKALESEYLAWTCWMHTKESPVEEGTPDNAQEVAHELAQEAAQEFQLETKPGHG